MREHTRIRSGHRGGRLLALVAVAGVVSTALVGAGSTTSGPAPVRADAGERPVVHSLDVPASRPKATATRDGLPVVAALDPTPVEDYGLVAVTWQHATASEGTEVRVRMRIDGAWTSWNELPVELDEGPSPTEETEVRDGTGPLWAGDATGVAVQIAAPDGTSPRDVRVEAIDPGRNPADSVARDDSTTSTDSTDSVESASPRFPAMPNVVRRADWGADESLNDQCWRPIYGNSARMVFVHHTVNSNKYTAAEAKRIVRGIHAYHTQSRGWCDIGYNFLIDKYGQIYQGRAGGVRRPVRGAHAGDYNANTVGVSLIGNFDKARPSKRMKTALVRFIGWRLGTSYAPVYGTVRIGGTTFRRISGHRDADQTACPGKYVYRWLPRLRDRVANYLSAYRSPIRKRAGKLGRSVTGEVFRGEARQSRGRRTEFGKGAMFAKADLGAHWLTGRALRGYRKRSGTHGRLGFPRTDVQRTGVDGVRRVVFENGRMFRIGKRQTYTLWGRILIRYRKLGGITGELGKPTSNMKPIKIGRKATFTNGSITWNRQSNTITVERS